MQPLRHHLRSDEGDATSALKQVPEGAREVGSASGDHGVRAVDDRRPGAYLQHNPDLGDGLAAGFAALAEDGRAITYTEVHFVVAEGNFVYTMSEGTMGEDPTAFFDLFRLEDGVIVEHWDTIATNPPADAFAHPNGKF